MQKLWLDLETYSEIPIKNGVHAYAEHAENMLFAWAIDDAPVNVWDLTSRAPIPLKLASALKDPEVLLYAHNSHFDRTVLNHAMTGIVAGGVERWRTACRDRWGICATFSTFRRIKPRIRPVSN